jgi:hypothetical protein
MEKAVVGLVSKSSDDSIVAVTESVLRKSSGCVVDPQRTQKNGGGV